MGETLRNVKYSASDAVKFEKVALKLGRTKRVVFSQMVDYFHRTRKDPLDIGDELLRNTMLKGQKDQIGFIRTQESELLIPIKRDVSRMAEAMWSIVGSFNSQVLAHNREVLDGHAQLAKSLSLVFELVGSVDRKARSAEKLKRSFALLLEGYIREREAFGMMTPSKEKEELAERFRRQIELL